MVVSVRRVVDDADVEARPARDSLGDVRVLDVAIRLRLAAVVEPVGGVVASNYGAAAAWNVLGFQSCDLARYEHLRARPAQGRGRDLDLRADLHVGILHDLTRRVA